MASKLLTFDKLAYIDRLKSAGIAETAARAHAEALHRALREKIATKQDVKNAVREITIWMSGVGIILFGVLATIKFFS